MTNKNYRAGRRLEYESMKRWEEKGYLTVRTAGSHGEYDVVAYRLDRKPEFIQCKRVSDEAAGKRLIRSFKEDTIPSSTKLWKLRLRVQPIF
jgi:hypothetical protein